MLYNANRLKTKFESMNKNKNGYISLEEIVAFALTKTRKGLSNKNKNLFLRANKKDPEGKMNLQEYLAMSRKKHGISNVKKNNQQNPSTNYNLKTIQRQREQTLSNANKNAKKQMQNKRNKNLKLRENRGLNKGPGRLNKSRFEKFGGNANKNQTNKYNTLANQIRKQREMTLANANRNAKRKIMNKRKANSNRREERGLNKGPGRLKIPPIFK